MRRFYSLHNAFSLQKLTAKPIWKLNLGGTGNTQKITNIATKNPVEHVHSQGRVFNDRSVLYKYINPNLVAIATQGPDNIHKCNRCCSLQTVVILMFYLFVFRCTQCSFD